MCLRVRQARERERDIRYGKSFGGLMYEELRISYGIEALPASRMISLSELGSTGIPIRSRTSISFTKFTHQP